MDFGTSLWYIFISVKRYKVIYKIYIIKFKKDENSSFLVFLKIH